MPDVAAVAPQEVAPVKIKPPVLVQVVVVLMWLSGFGIILRSILLIFVFGIGIIFILFGLYVIKCANDINKMRYRGYKSGLIVNGFILVVMLVSQYFSPIPLLQFSLEIILAAIPLAVLYVYRGKFSTEIAK